MLLPDLTFWVCPGGIEIPQSHPLQPVRLRIPVQHPLYEKLRLPIGVDGELRVMLGNGNHLRSSVCGASRGENDVLHSRIDHGVQQIERIHHIVAEVFARIAHGFANVSVRSKMDDRLNFVGPYHLSEQVEIRQITLYKRPPLHSPSMTRVQAIQHDRLKSGSCQKFGGMASDVPCTTCDQYSHCPSLPKRNNPPGRAGGILLNIP